MSSVPQQLAALERMSVTDLRRRYAEVFGEATNAGNRVWLIKRIAWRIQSLAEGSLSERARKRAEELARDADLRTTAPKSAGPVATGIVPRSATDDRLPPPGTVLMRTYKGRPLKVMVLSAGFECEGTVYPTLSAVAKAITGSHVNGFAFFGLARKEKA